MLIELAGEILEESLVTDIKPERLELLDPILSLEAFLNGVLATEEGESFLVPASTFLFKEFDGDFPMLSDKEFDSDLPILPDRLLPEDVEILGFVFVAPDRPEGDLDDMVGLGTMT